MTDSRLPPATSTPAETATPFPATSSVRLDSGALAPSRGVPVFNAVVFVLLAVITLAWDLYSKNSVFADLGIPGRGPDTFLLGDSIRFRLETSFNRGALWGLGQDFTWVFAVLSVVAALGILYWLFFRGGAASLWLTVALGMILGGTLGNLYDRLAWHGYVDEQGKLVHAVRDFLYFRFFDRFDWAVFNFADSFLVAGAIMLVIQSLFSPDGETSLQRRHSPVPTTAIPNAETPVSAT